MPAVPFGAIGVGANPFEVAEGLETVVVCIRILRGTP